MNIVAIDPSLISTALVVSYKDSFRIINYCRESKVYGKTGMTKWFKMADKITDQIIVDILESIDPNLPTKVGIEGYNFGAQVGDLIDLVTFSTLLRKKLFDKISQDITVMSPSTLKLESCKLTYKPIIKETGVKKKKITEEFRNNIGIPGGKFQKTDMAFAIIENEDLQDYWSKHCKSVSGDLKSVSTIPKPYEDCNDSYLIWNIIKKTLK